MKRNRFKLILVAVTCLLWSQLLSSGSPAQEGLENPAAIQSIPQVSGFVIDIKKGPQMTKESEWTEGTTESFTLKIDLLQITPTQIIQLKSDTVKAKNHSVVEYKFGFRASPESGIISYTLKINPTIIKEKPLLMQFKLNLFQDDTEMLERVIQLKEHESVMVELMENKETGAKLSFRLTPSLKQLTGEDIGKLAKMYDAAKEFFQDPSEHKVAVNVKLLPIFAVDTDGNPVYDLKKEDIALYINDTPVEIAHLRPYEFGKRDEKKDTKKGKETLKKEPDRVIVLIVDQVFNNWSGIKRGKDIAASIVKKGAPGDFFIIMINTPTSGLQYVAGPENDTEKLLAKIDDLKQLPHNRLHNLFSTFDYSTSVNEKWTDDSALMGGGLYSAPIAGKLSENLQYKADVQRFAYVLSQFKYALKTIDKPKIVFLISRGVARQSFNTIFELDNIEKNITIDVFLFNYFEKIARAINEGGSVLYTINSERMLDSLDRGESGKISLQEMAKKSGGEYFAGTNAFNLANQVNRTLSAYYELVFNPEGHGGKMNVVIKPKRGDITVHSVKHSEIERPYHTMTKVQKKLFALNVVNHGEWSRMVARIQKAKFKNIKKDKQGKYRLYTKLVKIPEALKNQDVDVFVVKKNPKTQKARIDLATTKVKKTLELKIKGTKDQDIYYVIIEPKYVNCIYNQVQ